MTAILAGLGLIEAYDLSSRGGNPVGGQGEPRADAGKPGDLMVACYRLSLRWLVGSVARSSP